MAAKWLTLIGGVSFWTFGVLMVMSWHSQQDHNKISAEYTYMKPITTEVCRHCFVDLKD